VRAERRNALAGVALSLGAAATFGVFAPAAKEALGGLGPVRGAGLAYSAAGLVALAALLARRRAGAASTARKASARDAPRLLGMMLLGGVLGPALFFLGIDRVAAHQAALVQHLEYVLTVLAAVLVLGERPGWRGYAGLLLVGSGLLLLSTTAAGGRGEGESSWAGVVLLAGACSAWAADNTLARGASALDPLLVVSIKGTGAGALLSLATWREPWSLPPSTWGLLFLAGGVGIGLSLVLELLALRRIGAARNAGLFATGPGFGFLLSVVALEERAGASSWAALALCVLGAVALAVDRHRHRHLHAPSRHGHPHHHLDGHHLHPHAHGVDPSVEHDHEHEHGVLEHAHEHVHDAHHRHRH
jgi:drug/metabolite transporter (DMT)-like permease